MQALCGSSWRETNPLFFLSHYENVKPDSLISSHHYCRFTINLLAYFIAFSCTDRFPRKLLCNYRSPLPNLAGLRCLAFFIHPLSPDISGPLLYIVYRYYNRQLPPSDRQQKLEWSSGGAAWLLSHKNAHPVASLQHL